MPSYIPRNLHECTCRGCGRPRPGRPRLPGVPGPGARIPPQGRQEGRGKALRPPARDGAHSHEPRHPKAPGDQTGPSGTWPEESVHSPRAVLGKQAQAGSINPFLCLKEMSGTSCNLQHPPALPALMKSWNGWGWRRSLRSS